MTQAPTPQTGILDIDLYEGGASHVDGVSDVLKLSSNENPLGASPKAIEAAQAAAAELHRYPSTDHAPLRDAIARVHDLDPSQIICGVGSDEILHLLCQAYAGPGDEVIHTEHGFAIYKIGALAAGATPVEVAERNRSTDVDAILAAITPKTKIVFIANPNNPTGTMIGDNELRHLAMGLPSDCLLVLDGAYAEFPEGYDGGAELAKTRANVVMTRTFSKVYGLGGVRVGWGFGPKDIIDTLNRIRGPFNLSHIALAAAEAAVNDQDYVTDCIALNTRERQRLAAGMDKLGFPSDPSHANFILVRTKDADEAGALDTFLKTKGVIVRRVTGYGLPAALRITVGDTGDVDRVLDTVAAFRETTA